MILVKVSIKLSVFIVLVSFVLSVSLLIICSINNKFNDKLLSQIIDDINSVVLRCSDEISSPVRHIQEANNMMSINEKLIGLLNNDSTDDIKRLTAIRELKSEYLQTLKIYLDGQLDGYTGYFFVNSSQPIASSLEYCFNNNFISNSANVYNDSGLASEDWYRELMKNDKEMYIFERSQTPNYIFLAQVIKNKFDYNNEILGINLIGIDLKNILIKHGNIQSKPFLEMVIINAMDKIICVSDDNVTDDIKEFATSYKSNNQSVNSVKINGMKYFVCTYTLDFGMRLVATIPSKDVRIEIDEITQQVFWIVALILLAAMVMAFVLSGIIVRPVKRLAGLMEKIDDTKSLNSQMKSSHITEIDSLYNSFNKMIQRINNLIDEAQHLGEQKKETEFKMLQAQINPHYLYNALDSITWMALRKGEDDIADMTEALADGFRYSIKSSDTMIDIRREIKFIENYVRLQEKRYKGCFKFESVIDDSVGDFKILKFIIQPLVENSIVHGLGRGNKNNKIKVTVARRGDLVEIRTEDDGIGFNAEDLNRYLNGDENYFGSEKVGIININKRLKNKYGNNAGLSYVSNERGGLTAIIVIPIDKGE